jgi:hypothetical protein
VTKVHSQPPSFVHRGKHKESVFCKGRVARKNFIGGKTKHTHITWRISYFTLFLYEFDLGFYKVRDYDLPLEQSSLDILIEFITKIIML